MGFINRTINDNIKVDPYKSYMDGCSYQLGIPQSVFSLSVCVSIFLPIYLSLYLSIHFSITGIQAHTYINVRMAVTRNRGLSRSPPPPFVTYLCRGPSVTNPCRGPLCRVLQSAIGLSQGGFVAGPPPRFCYKPCRKKAARACYKPDVFEALPHMYICRCICTCVHMYIYIYTHTHTHSLQSVDFPKTGLSLRNLT